MVATTASAAEVAEVVVNKKTGERETRTVSRIFQNHEFGFLRIVVERPLRMNFQTTPERMQMLAARYLVKDRSWRVAVMPEPKGR